MEVKIKQLPFPWDYRGALQSNYEFLLDTILVIRSTDDVMELNRELSILFSQKIDNPKLIFNYGWEPGKLIVYYEDRSYKKMETCLEVECDNEDFMNLDD